MADPRPPAPAPALADRPVARRSGFAARDDERLYWECVGAGPDLVLCHGAGGNHAVWFQQVPDFARARRVTVFDHRGFGRSSDRAGESGPAVAVADLEAVLGAAGVERADLVGQSMGGWTALGFAVAHPERVRRLVLADTTGGIPSPEVARMAQALAAAPPAASPPPVPPLGRHPALDDTFGARDPARAYLYQMLGAFGEPDLGRIGARLLAATVDPAALARLALPVLFVVGERDRLFPPAVIRACAAQVPGARVVEISGAGHSPYFERPEAWNAAVEAFLEEPRPGS